MANITGNVAGSGTLTSSTVQTVILAEARNAVRVVNRSGTSEIWFTVSEGTTPPVPVTGAVDCYVVPAVAGASTEVKVGTGPESVEVSMISAGTPTFTVETNQAN